MSAKREFLNQGTNSMSLVEWLRGVAESRWGSVLKWAAGIGVLVAVAYAVDWPTLARLSAGVRVHDALLVAALAIVAHFLGAVRFKLLCDPVVELPLAVHVRQYFVSACFSLFLPSLVGGDGARVVMLGRSGATTSHAATLVLAERIVGLISLAIVAAIGALATSLPVSIKASLVAGAIGGVLLLELGRRIGAAFKPTRSWVASALDAVARALGVERMGVVLGWSVLYQFVTVGVTALVAWRLSLDVPLALVFALTPLVWLATMIPISLGGLGVREAAFLVIFGWAGVASGPAMLLSLGTYAGIVAVGLAGAAWFAVQRRAAR